MRITSNQLANLVRRSVGDNTEKLYRAQEKVATQKSVNRPSDDPLAMSRILGYRTTLASIAQYSRNIEQAKMNIEFGEIQLEEVYGQLAMAKNMAIDQSSGDETTRLQTAEDIQNIYDRLLDTANTKLGDDYIFAGYQSGSAPFIECAEITFCDPSDLEDGDYFTLGDDSFVWYDKIGDGSGEPTVSGKSNIICVDISGAASADDVADLTAAAIVTDGAFEASVTEDATNRIQILDNETAPEIAEESDTGLTLHTVKYNGDDGDLNFVVSKTLKIKANATGDDVFTGDSLSDGVNVFDLLKELKDAFEAPTLDSDWIVDIKDNLIKGYDQVQKAAVDFAVAYTRLESTENYWSQFKLTVENMLSDDEDVDLAQAVVELQQQETVYEAALAASSALFDKSLIDFLR